MSESILMEAERLTNGDRQMDYGHPIHDFTCIVEQLNALGFRRYDKSDMKELRPLKATDWPIAMECVKKSREWNSHKRDNPVDGAGYWNTLEMIYEYLPKVT